MSLPDEIEGLSALEAKLMTDNLSRWQSGLRKQEVRVHLPRFKLASKFQLAETVGLKRETFYKASRARAPKTQARMREMLEIISRVVAWAGGKDQAMAWYRAQPIPELGGRTAEALVKSGRASAVRDYLDHIAMGGFA